MRVVWFCVLSMFLFMCFDFELFLSVVVVYCIGVLLINFGMFDVFMLCVVWCYLVEFLLDLWVVEIL